MRARRFLGVALLSCLAAACGQSGGGQGGTGGQAGAGGGAGAGGRGGAGSVGGAKGGAGLNGSDAAVTDGRPATDGARDTAADGSNADGNGFQNPPTPVGWQLMPQSQVTPEMTTWAVAILDDPTTYPMFSTAVMTFGSVMVLVRVEWHPPDFQNSTFHRGVTLYIPAS